MISTTSTGNQSDYNDNFVLAEQFLQTFGPRKERILLWYFKQLSKTAGKWIEKAASSGNAEKCQKGTKMRL